MLDALAAVLLWGVVLWRVRMVTKSSAQRNLWSALTYLAAAQVLNFRAAYGAFNELTGVPYSATTIKQALVVVSAAHVHRMLHGLRLRGNVGGRRHSWRAAALAAAALVIIISPAVAGERAAGFASDAEYYQLTVLGVAAWIAYLAYLAWALLVFARMCWSYGHASAAGPLRTGLFLGGAGAAYGLAHVLHKGSLLAGVAIVGPEAGRADGAITVTVLGPTLLLCAVGSCYPAMALKAEKAKTHYRAWRSLQRLYPLWRALLDAAPEVALTPAPTRLRDAVSLRDANWRLVRRVIEIRDGLLAVRPYLPVEEAANWAAEPAAHSCGWPEATAAAEAAALEAARHAKLRGVPPSIGRSYPRGDGGSDLESEVCWLEDVARARRALTSNGSRAWPARCAERDAAARA